MKNIQELLNRGLGAEKTGQLLIQTDIYNTLIKAVRSELIGRRYCGMILGPSDIKGSSVDVNLQTADTMSIYEVAEGAEVPMDVEAYTTWNVKPVKYAVRIYMTSEMEEDAKWEMFRYNVETAGYTFAENEDTLFIAQLDAANTAAVHTVSGSTAITIANITAAQKLVRDDKYRPTTMLIGSEILQDLQNIDTFVEADKWGNRDTIETGFVKRFLGMDVVFNHSITSTYAFILDPRHAVMLAEKRPITMKAYDDAVRDSRGIVITQRIAFRYIRAEAVSKITTT